MFKDCIYAKSMLQYHRVDANFSIQLSSQSQFSKGKIEEVKAETKCEKHKKKSCL